VHPLGRQSMSALTTSFIAFAQVLREVFKDGDTAVVTFGVGPGTFVVARTALQLD